LDHEKICENCGVEFNEQDNFNWSCLTHKSEYGEDMWWCCGKKGEKAKGCMKQKHVERDHDEDSILDIEFVKETYH
jgi:hypothetical protein